MIKPSSIQAVKDKLDIVTVVSHYAKLDRHNKACCPFHGEKTPSFSVDAKKDIFKCFGCGAGGDAIKFVMDHEKQNFIEAIETIAKIIGVELEREEIKDPKKYEAEKSLQDQMHQVLHFTVDQYRNNLWNLDDDHPVKKYVRERKLTRNEVAEWQLGWSTTDWRFLTPQIINQNLYTAAEKLGIVKRSKNDESNFDGYRSRVIIPINDHHGKCIGIAGRYIQLDATDDGKNFPKYINPCENELYNKSRVLFGMSKATKAIRDLQFAFLVEGYFDVISMHKGGHANTVASCGTALTDHQCKLLARHTNHVCILRDGDDAGINASKKDLMILLRNGFKVSIITLPKNEDPDSYVCNQMADAADENFIALLPKMEDAVNWYVRNLVEDAKDDTYKTALVKQEVVHLLSHISNGIIRNNFFDAICKKYKWKANELQKELNAKISDDDDDEKNDDGKSNYDNMPEWMNKDEFFEAGFCKVHSKKRIGFYLWNGAPVELTNFVIKPLIHIYAAKESRYMIQVDNGRKKAVLDIEAKAMVSVDLLQQYVVAEGAFVIYGNKAQMLRVANHLLNQFPLCREVEFLGWQQHGFFAFVDRVFVPGAGIKDLDEWGIIKHDENNHLIPAASAAYAQVRNTAGDPYENLRYLKFAQSPISFEQWAKLMHRVYEDKGIVSIAYTILTAFRDVVFSVDNNCPHLYFFGERSSGKSKTAESIMAFFYVKRPAFNLNSGTDFAFFNYMQLFINCPAALNEADEKVLKPEWFQIIKGAYDGEGRQRGVIGSKNKTEIMKVQSTLVLMGQYLMTTDDNSIVSRSLIESFTERELSEEDKNQYVKLKEYEEAGLTSMITEIVAYRKEFKAMYKDQFNETLGLWRRSLNGDSGNFNQRIMQNWCHLYTCYAMMGKYFKLPVSNDHFENYCKQKAVHWSGFIRASDTLSEFWNTFSFLVDQGIIIDGWDFKIEEITQIKVLGSRTDGKDGRQQETTHAFNDPTKVLYLRLNNVHKHYQQAYRSRTGKEGMTIENLKHYFTGRKYFLGNNKQSIFKRYINKTDETTGASLVPGGAVKTSIETKKVSESTYSSSYVFMYDHLGIDIERNKEVAEELPF
jgi:DNA primase